MINLKSIRSRILWSYLLIIISTVIILEAIIMVGVKQYYYGNVEMVLQKQAEVADSFYSKYLASGNLKEDAIKLLDTFSSDTAAQVQIIDNKYVLLRDSSELFIGKKLNYPDIKRAMTYGEGKWTGRISYSDEKVMAVSRSLRAENRTFGVIRLITSLTALDNIIYRIYALLIFAGLIVMLIVVLVSTFVSRTITRPVKELTYVAEQMAKGRFSIVADKRYDDEIGKLSDTLNYMAGEIMKNETLKNEFISSVSHELRTPLTSIKGWVITLRTGKEMKTDEVRQGLNIIEEEGERLTAMVEELLDFSRLAGGKMTLNLEDININKVIKNVWKQMLPRANRNGIGLTCELYEEIPVVQGDGNKLKQVFINLIDNSLKFTEAGGNIKLKTEAKNEKVIIIVEDNGCGIDEGELSKVTQKFYQVDSKSGGSGIGLAICDEIIKLHGGMMKLESKKDCGTKVIIELINVKICESDEE